VELCASTNIAQKRVGYLAASLCLAPSHEFRFMLVNQLQRDMNSTNHLEACAALAAVCKIVNEDMIPAVIGDVLKALRHDVDAVRRKAICALHRLYQLDKTCVIDHVEKVRRMICDKDPSVMGASLGLLHAMIADAPGSYKDLVPSLVSILKQIADHRLPRDFDYHRVPAPWIQMRLLRTLAVLGRGDRATSEGMYEVILDIMRKADTGVNVGYAIVFEAVQTVTTIYPSPALLDAAATSISRFIRSESHNLKYMGIKGLAAIVHDHPKYAADHQMAVVDCLEDPDETLKRKTLDLLVRMTNAVNVEFIVAKLLAHLASAATAGDDHFRADLVSQITQCAERFAPSNAWYIHTIVKVALVRGPSIYAPHPRTSQALLHAPSNSPSYFCIQGFRTRGRQGETVGGADAHATHRGGLGRRRRGRRRAGRQGRRPPARGGGGFRRPAGQAKNAPRGAGPGEGEGERERERERERKERHAVPLWVHVPSPFTSPSTTCPSRLP
jgi:AP-4 complex subunit epsilon-1